jgi:hypothetical protein
MEHRRRDGHGVVWRNVPKEKRANTVFLTTTVLTKQCRKCGKVLPLSDFYLESKSRRKHEDDVRNMCVCCWDLYNGKTDSKSFPVASKYKVDDFL